MVDHSPRSSAVLEAKRVDWRTPLRQQITLPLQPPMSLAEKRFKVNLRALELL